MWASKTVRTACESLHAYRVWLCAASIGLESSMWSTDRLAATERLKTTPVSPKSNSILTVSGRCWGSKAFEFEYSNKPVNLLIYFLPMLQLSSRSSRVCNLSVPPERSSSPSNSPCIHQLLRKRHTSFPAYLNISLHLPQGSGRFG